jgi:hypothetical protein
VDFESEELFKEFMNDFSKLAEDVEPVVLRMDFPTAWNVFVGLQLALKHPDFPDTSFEICEKVALWLEGQVAKTDALKKVAKGGWEGVPVRGDDFEELIG